MARMNRLFGVTMAERGLSQLVSVDLEGAVKLREAVLYERVAGLTSEPPTPPKRESSLSLRVWVPAFAGRAERIIASPPLIPAQAGIHGFAVSGARPARAAVPGCGSRDKGCIARRDCEAARRARRARRRRQGTRSDLPP